MPWGQVEPAEGLRRAVVVGRWHAALLGHVRCEVRVPKVGVAEAMADRGRVLGVALGSRSGCRSAPEPMKRHMWAGALICQVGVRSFG